MSCDYNPYTLPILKFVGGSTQDLAFHVYFQSYETPFDLSSCTANFAVINYTNRDGEPVISKAMTVEHDTGSLSNILSVTLLPSDTVDLVGKYIYQVTIRDVAGYTEIPDQGIMFIANNINKNYVR